ncbi:Hypothetical protein POVN_LOCUS387 [uncultured virus]|nr:Hypothetical protein POVN_LOCUS387 [uncultured virus]
MTEALTTLRDLVKRIDAAIEAKIPLEDAFVLGQWLYNDGLASLKTPLIHLISEHEPAIHPDIAKEGCVDELLNGWTPGRLIASAGGKIYEMVKAGQFADRVLKVAMGVEEEGSEDAEEEEERLENEAKYGKIAGDLGIGPYVYGSATCLLRGKHKVHYTVMQRLSGPTLKETHPYKVSDITDALTLHYKLITDGYMLHEDTHTGNIMFDGKERRMYIIDYGLVAGVTPEETKNPARVAKWIRTIAAGLIDDLINVYHIPSSEVKRQTADWISLNTTIETWLTELFGFDEPIVRLMHAGNLQYVKLDLTDPYVSKRFAIYKA